MRSILIGGGGGVLSLLVLRKLYACELPRGYVGHRFSSTALRVTVPLSVCMLVKLDDIISIVLLSVSEVECGVYY